MAPIDTASNPPVVDLNANHIVETVIISVVFLFLSLLSILARLASRRMQSVGFKADEALLVVSWIITCGDTVMMACSTKYAHSGRHIQALSQKQLVAFQKTYYAGSFLQPAALGTAKISVLLLLRRIFVTPRFRTTIWILGGIILALGIAIFFGSAFACFPPASMWDSNLHGTILPFSSVQYQ